MVDKRWVVAMATQHGQAVSVRVRRVKTLPEYWDLNSERADLK